TLVSLHYHHLSHSFSSSSAVSPLISQVTALKEEFAKGLATGFYEVEEYFHYYFCYANCVKRYGDDYFRKRLSGTTKGLTVASTTADFTDNEIKFLHEELVSAVQQIETCLTSFAPNWFPGWIQFLYYQSYLKQSRGNVLEGIVTNCAAN